MQVGDLIKHKKYEWYAIVIGFRTKVTVGEGCEEALEEGNNKYPIFVWVKNDVAAGVGEGKVDSCYHRHMEVVQSPYRSNHWFPIDALVA